MKTAEGLLREKGTEIISVTPETSIYDALQKMIKNNIGAILIEDNGEIIGIWTERDLMRDTLSEGFNPKTAKIKDFMITDLITANHTDNIYNMMDVFLGKRLRHLLVKKDEKYIGLLSIGDVVKAQLNEKTKELDELHAMVSWDYYSNWRWEKK